MSLSRDCVSAVARTSAVSAERQKLARSADPRQELRITRKAKPAPLKSRVRRYRHSRTNHEASANRQCWQSDFAVCFLGKAKGQSLLAAADSGKFLLLL